MLEEYFQFLPGVGPSLERRWKRAGIRDWSSAMRKELPGLSERRAKRVKALIGRAQMALLEKDHKFFMRLLPVRETWRLYPLFKDEAVYLDIETTGLSRWDKVTLIGISDGYEAKSMIRGINLDVQEMKKELRKYKLLVTFNGRSFDVPFLERRYPGIVPKIPHIDLRLVCAQVGLRGGLKAIEKRLKIKRGNKLIESFDGGDAVTLWRMYRSTGDREYLDLLAEYNEEDIINLKPILEHCMKKLRLANL